MMRKAIAFSRLSRLVLHSFCPSALGQNKSAPALDLNSATVEWLQRVPGIAPTSAAAIVNFRRKKWAVSSSGRFACDQGEQ
jgi:DNA uptake protein ComE-like DNA-binding protein